MADAFALFQRGDLDGAAGLLADILAHEPDNADAIHLLAGVHHARGDLAAAAPLFERAHQLSPYDAEITFNHAAILSALARHGECVAACEAFLALRPGDPEALFLQGASLAALGRHEEALTSYERTHLDRTDLHARRAASLLALGRAEEALAAATRAGELDGRNVDALYQRALALGAVERWPDALVALDAATALAPKNISIRAARAPALANLGRFGEALREIDAALARHPGRVEYLMRRAYVLKAANRWDDALAAYDAVLAVDPDNADAQYAKADLLLSAGDFGRGLPLYEARWRVGAPRVPPPSRAPLWTGKEPIAGKAILVQGEQGFGDLFQFCRFIPMLAERGARVILQERPQTLALMRTLAGVSELASASAPAPMADFHIPLASLMRALDVRLETIPASNSYLHADSVRAGQWRERLGPSQRLRVGVTWSGVTRHATQRSRSLDDAALEQLFGADVEFVSLQMEESPIAAEHGVRQFGGDIADFAELAALIDTLDVVVSIDTGVAHLAGALGKRVLLMLPFHADWRWLRERADSPWYPNMRLFRQPSFGDWPNVVADVRAALQE